MSHLNPSPLSRLCFAIRGWIQQTAFLAGSLKRLQQEKLINLQLTLKHVHKKTQADAFPQALSVDLVQEVADDG